MNAAMWWMAIGGCVLLLVVLVASWRRDRRGEKWRLSDADLERLLRRHHRGSR